MKQLRSRAPPDTGSTASFALSVADFLDIVKNNYADVLSLDVNSHYGLLRPNSVIEGLRFSEKDDFDLFQSILDGTDDIDYDSVLMDSENAPADTTARLIYDAGKILKEGIEAAGSLTDVNITMDIARNMATYYLNQYNS